MNKSLLTLGLWHTFRQSSSRSSQVSFSRGGSLYYYYYYYCHHQRKISHLIPLLLSFRNMSSNKDATVADDTIEAKPELGKRRAEDTVEEEISKEEKVVEEKLKDDNDAEAAEKDDDEAWFGGGKKKKKRSKKEAKINHTRRRNTEGKHVEKEPHAGSFANAEQRKLFGVELPPEEDPEIASTRSKRKVAFLLGYLGTNYTGFQINGGQRTLQGDFELALLRCNFLMRSNFGYPHKYGWSTSGRTDKGVHACAQVTSAKIELLPDQTFDDVRDELNKKLPEDFRCLDVKKTTRNFCAHTQRDRVRYQYMFPSFVLCDIAKLRAMFEEIGAPKNGRSLGDPLSEEEVAKIRAQLKNFRATETQLDLLKKALKEYEGTHSFHNFSKGVKGTEARAARFIEYFRVEEPIVFEDGTEWIPTQVYGQSFLLHQIRKMACMAMDIARGGAPVETISRAFSKTSDIRVSPAPAQGLYLDMSFYTGYNRRKQANPDLPDLNWWEEDTEEFKRWKAFRNGVVMKQVVKEEARDGNFVKHLFIQEYGFSYREFYQLDGAKPAESTEKQKAEVADS